jgi:hypothetical protein
VVKETKAALIVRQRREWDRYYGCLKAVGRPLLVAREYYTDDGDEYLFSEDYLRLRGRFAAVAMAGCLEACALAEIAIAVRRCDGVGPKPVPMDGGAPRAITTVVS